MGWGGKLKSIVKAVAPTLGAALGGPAGGMAAKIISEGILGKPDASEAEIEDFLLTASPEQMLELKKLDAQFAVDMKKLDIDVFRIESDDKKSARAMFGINIVQISLTALSLWLFRGPDCSAHGLRVDPCRISARGQRGYRRPDCRDVYRSGVLVRLVCRVEGKERYDRKQEIAWAQTSNGSRA